MPTNDGRGRQERQGGGHDSQGNANGGSGSAAQGPWRQGAEEAARQSRRETERDEELIRNEDFDPAEYDTMLTLERLESLEEEMIELDVKTLDDVRRRIAELHHQLDEELTP